IGGENVPRAEIASNRIHATTGNAIHSSAATSIIHHNDIEGQYGISLTPDVLRGLCRDNVITVSTVAIIDDGGSGVRVEDNIVPPGAAFSTSIGQTLPPGPTPSLTGKRWFRKLEASTISRLEEG